MRFLAYQPGMFKGAAVAILGFGVNNQAVARWLLKQGAVVTICDERAEARQAAPDLWSAARWQLGKQAFRQLDHFAYLFRTPGLRPDHPAIEEALAGGKTVLTSQTELFFALCPATIIGITGTKGKGTTASLLSLALKEGRGEAGFRDVFLAGNIGKDPFEFVDTITPEDCVILELSSFQLFGARLRPKVAILLSLSPDHLNWHANIHEYAAAKSNLVRYQTADDIAIFHAESEHLKPFITATAARVYLFSRRERVARGTYVGFDGHRRAVFMTGEAEPLLSEDDLSIPGEHNLENAAAAALAAYLLGVSRPTLRAAFASFTGLPHRLQRVYAKRGVTFIDDSIATTPEALVAAIKAFSPHPIHLLAGGVSKGADLTAALKYADQHCASVTLIGQNKHDFARHFQTLTPRLAANMEEAVRQIMKQAQAGDVVLLSPASASFDLYANYAARGDDFAQRVKANSKLLAGVLS